MEHTFSSKETGNGYLAFPRGWMEGTDVPSMENDAQGMNLVNSSTNVAELMNFDAYGGWCNSPCNLADQMSPSLVFSPYSALSANFSPFDGSNFTDPYSGVTTVNGDIRGNSPSGGDKVVFPQVDNQLPVPTNSDDNEASLNKTRDKSSNQHYFVSDVGNTLIPRPPSQPLAEKMLRAMHLLKDWFGEGLLAQVWVPMRSGDQYILSTSEQPYLLDQNLSGFREASTSFTFAAESKPGSFLGLPGRVFISRIPEWTSNVMSYNNAEYLRIQYAVDHKVQGSIALPVFEDDSCELSCCAVLELVTVKAKSNFDMEMENVCHALEAVNLRSKAPPRLSPQSLSTNQRLALAEISDVLRAVCHAHRLPLALTWIPCNYSEVAGDETIRLRARGYDTSLNKKCVLCIEDTACYVNKDLQSFVHACAHHYLEEGQGVVGKALQSNHPSFFPDVKQYHVTEYPLVHHARKFGLNAAVAIRLRSTYTSDDDYILEFFLAVNMKGSTEQQLLLNNLSITMKRVCKSLRTVSDAELLRLEDSKVKLCDNKVENVPVEALSRRSAEQSLIDGDSTYVYRSTEKTSELTAKGVEADCSHQQPIAGSRKQTEKKRSTSEKHVNLSVLQQYFSGSLKDAAKSIGVCPTTLKRICRKYDISRWPSRKINKVNRSLRKIQSDLDSVEGVEGGFKFNPVTGGFMAVSSIIQEFNPRNRIISPDQNHLINNSDIVIESAKSTPVSSCMASETTFVKMEEECVFDGNQVAGVNLSNTNSCKGESKPDCTHNSILLWPATMNTIQWTACPKVPESSILAIEGCHGWVLNSSMKAEASESLFTSRSSRSVLAVDEIETKWRDDSGMDNDDGVVEHNQPISSETTDSSHRSGSMTNRSSSSSRSFGEKQNQETKASYSDSGSKIAVKATYKEGTIRFRLERAAGCIQLYEEVEKRFNLQIGQFQLKYVDDEEEWVRLENDSDLLECLEVLDFMGRRSVKLMVCDVPTTIGSSSGSNSFLGGVCW